ncbi:tyrosine-protein kinase STYK1 [Bufo gargarizans]|uniref:tyrosine-protein kinase STYK1 n=1 Tax=Bufo gargarizans TaxID=30331 RepID=UPI001CF14C99|nr:tyrosine-protein kinase STYK1 [Bufo gargarizans]XP_044155116.1 tyrosine-protein kinase STYK1 [Bufo gargarizans]
MDDQHFRPPARTLLNCTDQLCIVETYQYEVIVIPVFLIGIAIILLAIIFCLQYRSLKLNKKRAQAEQDSQENYKGGNSGIRLAELSLDSVLRTRDPSLLELEVQCERISEPFQLMAEGRFGPIYRTALRDTDGREARDIVVKQLKGTAEPYEVRDFLQRAAFQAWLGSHSNLVEIIGCCTETKPFSLVLECVEPGSLLQFLWDCRRDLVPMDGILYDLTECQVYTIALQILAALEFLHERKLLHGDVAARNVLIQRNFTAKLTGLGGACEMHLRGNFPIRRPAPLKWLSPERLLYLPVTEKADVWSFGILLYEMITLGAPPYPGVPPSNILQHLQRGTIMKRPPSCKQQLYNIIKACWTWKMGARISVPELKKRLQVGKKSSDDRTVLQIPELVIPELYAEVAGTEALKMENDYTVF